MGPTKTQIKRLVELFAKNLSANEQNAPVAVRQRAFRAFNKYRDQLSSKYPGYDMSSPFFFASLTEAARKVLSQKVVRGCGSEW